MVAAPLLREKAERRVWPGKEPVQTAHIARHIHHDRRPCRSLRLADLGSGDHITQGAIPSPVRIKRGGIGADLDAAIVLLSVDRHINGVL